MSQEPFQQHTINRIHYYPAVMVLETVIQNPHHAVDTHTEPMVQYVQYHNSDPTEQGREWVQAACYLSTQQPGEQNGICTVAYQAFRATSVPLKQMRYSYNIQTICRPYSKFYVSVIHTYK